MNKNVKIAKQLVRLAKSLCADNEENPYVFVLHCTVKDIYEDDYENGESLDNYTRVAMDATVEDTSLRKCVEKMCNQLDIHFADNIVSIIDNQIILSTEENEQDSEATQQEMDAFKNGKIKLFACYYNCDVTLKLSKVPDEDFLTAEFEKK